MTAGRSTVLPTDFDITRIARHQSRRSPTRSSCSRARSWSTARAPGTVSLIIWGADTRAQYDLVVEPAITDLAAAAADAVPGRRHRGQRQRRSDHPVGPRVEQRRDAARGEIAAAIVAEEQGHQPAAGARRQREPAGDAAGAVRRGEPQGADRARRQPVRQSRRGLRRGRTTPAVRRADLRRRRSPTATDVQRFPEPVRLRHARTGIGARHQGAAVEGRLPEPGRAEPDRLQRPGSQLPRRRRVPGSDRAGRHGTTP